MHRRQSLRVAFLTRYDRQRASSRVRVYDYLPHLEKMGFVCCVLPFVKPLSLFTKARYLSQALWLARWANVVVLQKLVLRQQFISLLHRANPALIFDFDDALYTPTDSLSHDGRIRAYYEKETKRLHYIFQKAQCVISGNHYLASYAKRFTSSVHVLPSSVDLEHYPLKEVGNDGVIVFGWIGSPENLLDFQPVRASLQKVLQKTDGNVALRIVSIQPPSLYDVPVQFEKWELDKQISFLHSFDVGLMPLNNTERSRGRSAFKAIQYMAVGLPVIASPIGTANEVVEHGKTGFLASTSEEWVEYMIRLAKDKTLRVALGKRGRAKVEQYYSTQVNSPKLAAILKEVSAP